MEAVEHMPGISRDKSERLSSAVRDYGPRLRAFIRRRVSDVTDAEDLAQDVLTELVAVDMLQPIERIAGWLLRVAGNRIVDRYRSRARERQRLGPAGTGDEPERLLEEWRAPAADDPDSAYARAEFLDALEEALAELPAAQRDVFVAHELEGKSFRDLAAASGESINTLLGRKHAAVRALRARLGEQRDGFEE